MRLINTYMQKVVIYPGRFQPMLAHHAEVYKKLQAQFPDAKVYVGTSNKVDGEKSPFNFEEKQLIATAHGISAEAVLPGKLPYHKDSYPQFDEKNTMIIFAVGEKDLGRFPFDNVDSDSGLQMTKRGEPRPAYYQKIETMANDPVPMEHRGYITIAPTIQIGDEVASASAFRERIKNAPNEEEAKKYFVNQFGEYNEKVFDLIYNKIVRNKMSEELNIMRKLAGLSEAPVNFDDYQTISPKDAKQAAQRPELRANADPEAAKFLPPDPKMFHSTIAKSVANRMGVEDVNDPTVKKEHFMRELLKSPAVLLGEINARLANDDNGLAVSDRLSEIIEELDGGLGGLSAEDKQFVIKITANAIKNMELAKDPKADKEREEYEAESLDLSDIRNDYGIEEASVCKQCGSSECDCPEGECTCEPVEEAEGDDCEKCNGTGKLDRHSEDPHKCNACDGKGKEKWKPEPTDFSKFNIGEAEESSDEVMVAKMLAKALGDPNRWTEMSAPELYAELESTNPDVADMIRNLAKMLYDVKLEERAYKDVGVADTVKDQRGKEFNFDKGSKKFKSQDGEEADVTTKLGKDLMRIRKNQMKKTTPSYKTKKNQGIMASIEEAYGDSHEITLEDNEDFNDVFGVLGYSLCEQDTFEAEYQGRKVKLNKPMQGDVKKFKVYVKDPKTKNVKKVNFGHGGSSVKGKAMKIRKNNPKARKSFRARHNCDNPGPKTKARYWSCRKW
jgi:hypothetical protein